MALSKVERDKRFKRGQQSARETIAAKEIFSLRLPPATISRIFEIASSRNMHASDLVRGWIEQCIESDQRVSPATDNANVHFSDEILDSIRRAIHDEFKKFSAGS